MSDAPKTLDDLVKRTLHGKTGDTKKDKQNLLNGVEIKTSFIISEIEEARRVNNGNKVYSVAFNGQGIIWIAPENSQYLIIDKVYIITIPKDNMTPIWRVQEVVAYTKKMAYAYFQEPFKVHFDDVPDIIKDALMGEPEENFLSRMMIKTTPNDILEAMILNSERISNIEAGLLTRTISEIHAFLVSRHKESELEPEELT